MFYSCDYSSYISLFFPNAIAHLVLASLVFIFLASSSIHRLDRMLGCSRGPLTFLQTLTSLPSSPSCMTMPDASSQNNTSISGVATGTQLSS